MSGGTPGSAIAVAAGCTCPPERQEPELKIFRCDKDCPLHGLHLVKALLEDGDDVVVVG